MCKSICLTENVLLTLLSSLTNGQILSSQVFPVKKRKRVREKSPWLPFSVYFPSCSPFFLQTPDSLFSSPAHLPSPLRPPSLSLSISLPNFKFKRKTELTENFEFSNIQWKLKSRLFEESCQSVQWGFLFSLPQLENGIRWQTVRKFPCPNCKRRIQFPQTYPSVCLKSGSLQAVLRIWFGFESDQDPTSKTRPDPDLDPSQ